jgi:threonylcarbamoyladenosine tRNA methylthiotransferase MtaB
MATPRTVSFYTLGCKLNYSETSSISRSFEGKGYAVVPFEQGADIVVINTCSVTDFADRKNRKIIRKAQKYNANAIIVVIGCYAQLKPEEIANIPGVDLVLGAGEKFRILHYIDTLVKQDGKASVHTGEISEINAFEDAWSFGDRTRSFLKVQDGCNYLCTYCTIPQARGKSRSATIEEVVRNAQEIAASGVKEIVLTGVNIGDFGNSTEIIEGTRPRTKNMFIDLIRALDQVEGIERFRISSIEPNLLTPEIVDFVAQSQKFVPHFHIPLQSGSDTILKNMKRRYLTPLYRERIDYIRSVMPHASIGVDVIVGFPGETDALFAETMDFVKALDVSYLHVFTYSARSNTPAYEMKDQVPMDVRRERNTQLTNISLKKQKAFYDQFVGQTRQVLVEKSKDPKLLTGFTDNYLKVDIPYEEGLRNQLAEVKLEKVKSNYHMKASIVSKPVGSMYIP